MKKILLFLLLVSNLFGCSKEVVNKNKEVVNKNSEYKAWNDTYWGMSKEELREVLLNLVSESRIEEGKCAGNEDRSYDCLIVFINDYQIGHQHYDINFSLKNDKLSGIYFMHEESSWANKQPGEDVLELFQRTKLAGEKASLELNALLTQKYGLPTHKDISEQEIKIIWEKSYTTIELKNSSIGMLSYKPNTTQFYLDTVPNDSNKL